MFVSSIVLKRLHAFALGTGISLFKLQAGWLFNKRQGEATQTFVVAQAWYWGNCRSRLTFVLRAQVQCFQILPKYKGRPKVPLLSGCGWIVGEQSFYVFWVSRLYTARVDNNLPGTPVCKVNAPSPRCLIYTESSLFMGRIWSINSCFTKLENKSTERRLNDFPRSGKRKS